MLIHTFINFLMDIISIHVASATTASISEDATTDPIIELSQSTELTKRLKVEFTTIIGLRL